MNSANEAPWLHYYSADGDVVQMSRAQFWRAVQQATLRLADEGVGPGHAVMLALTANRLEDLIWRTAAMWLGAVPATFNWQADDLQRLLFKIRLTKAKVIIYDRGLAPGWLAALRQLCATHAFIELRDWARIPEWRPPPEVAQLDDRAPRITVFTSGTTGQPKGVLHSYYAYRVNQLVFERFLNVEAQTCLQAIVVNPLHHTNATAICDWAMRRPNSELHLFERYTSLYWQRLAEISETDAGRPVATLVSRHFDFLESLIDQGRLEPERIKKSLSRVDFLLGSAPVGPQTVARFERFIGTLPLVRFGSTETCLQLIGTPQEWSEATRKSAFKAGWQHDPVGYFIGRAHAPWTELKIVRSIDRDSDQFMQPCDAGEPGFFVARTESVMLAYVGDDAATMNVMHDGWYLGLQDIGFFLESPMDGAQDIYWMSRESTLLIRGGANYAYDQVAERLKTWAEAHFGLNAQAFALAVVGDRKGSEHEDRCLVMWQSLNQAARDLEDRVGSEFVAEAAKAVPKGMRPDAVQIGEIPKNFKGAIQVKALRELFD